MQKSAFRYFLRILAAIAAVLFLCPAALSVSAADAYVYSYEGDYRKSLPLYIPTRNINLSAGLEIPLQNPTDICVMNTGDIAIADGKNNRVLIYDEKYSLKRELTGFLSDGVHENFSEPSGLTFDSEGRLYVADTENGRVIILNPDDTLNRIIGKPEGTGVTEDFVYKPIAVAASTDGRVYAVSRSSNMGVLSFGSDGVFEGFLGVQPVTFSAADMFWRVFMTRAQRERTLQNIPVDFSDIALDSEGFLFAVSPAIDKSSQYNALVSGSSASDYAPVKRLNPSGDDILRRTGFSPPAGDLDIDSTKAINLAASAFSAVAVTDSGVYSVVDATNQRIFTYSPDGNLLCAFGGSGSSLGQFRAASAIAYKGEVPLILDGENGRLTVYEMSEYGALVNEAIGLQAARKYEDALQKWEEVLAMNANLDMVYLDMGKAYIRAGEYDKAMDSFSLVGEKEYYSKAFAEKRSGSISWMLIVVPLVIVGVIVGFSLLFRRMKAANYADDINPPAKITLRKQLQFAFVPLFHPFDGFYVLKRQKRGGLRGALCILAGATSAALMFKYLSGYLFSDKITSETNILMDAAQFIFPFLLFAVANFCVTTLFDGEGTFRQIFITVCYALLPLVLILPATTIAANFLSLNEEMILTLLRTIAYGWSLLLIFSGMIAIHQYGFFKNIWVTLFSLVGMLIIAFLLMLFASLTQKFVMFLQNVVMELSYRL